MAPSKVDVQMEGSSKSKEVEGEVVSSITSSFTQLTLDANTPKDVAKLEDNLARMNLRDRSVLVEEKNEETDSEKTVNGVLQGKDERISCQTDRLLSDNEVVGQEYEEKEEKKQEEEEEQVVKIKKDEEEAETEEIEKKDDKLRKEEEEESDDDNYTKPKLEEEEEKEERKEEHIKKPIKKMYQEEVSDDENPADDENITSKPRQSKDGRIRSRGLGCGPSQGYSHIPSTNLDYMGGMTYQQQQQQQQQQQCQEIWPQATHQFQGAWSPQHAQMAGYSGASPTHTAAMGDTGEGYSAGSPFYDEAYANSPMYQQDSPSMPYQQGVALSPQYHDVQSTHYQQHQYQDNQAPSFQQSLSQNIQYQGNQAMSYHQASPQALSPPQYLELPYSTQMSPMSVPLDSSILTPPVSPQPAQPLIAKPANTIEATQCEDIVKIIDSITEQESFDNEVPYNKTVIEITRSLLDIGKCPDTNIEDELNQSVYQLHYREYAGKENEALVEGDEDGDILYMRAACSGQMEEDYNEKLVAFTKRIEKMNLCCDTVVDRRTEMCQKCGNSDPKSFYSPLSWKNNHGEMLLSNLVILMFPRQVIQYITKKVMQRPMDFQRTFIPYYDLFYNNTDLYPCLLQGLAMLSTRKHKNHD